MRHVPQFALDSCQTMQWQRSFADVIIMLQAASFSQLNKAKLGIWEALQQLHSLDAIRVHTRRAADKPQMSLFDQAVQTAELCRLTYPQQDWLHLIGLIHSLGKLMALPRFLCYSNHMRSCTALALTCVKCTMMVVHTYYNSEMICCCACSSLLHTGCSHCQSCMLCFPVYC